LAQFFKLDSFSRLRREESIMQASQLATLENAVLVKGGFVDGSGREDFTGPSIRTGLVFR